MPATRSTTLLPGLLDRLADYRRLRQAVTQGKSPLALSGLAAVHRAHFAAALRQDTKRPLVLVCPDDAEARRLLAWFFSQAHLRPPRYRFTPTLVEGKDYEVVGGE